MKLQKKQIMWISGILILLLVVFGFLFTKTIAGDKMNNDEKIGYVLGFQLASQLDFQKHALSQEEIDSLFREFTKDQKEAFSKLQQISRESQEKMLEALTKRENVLLMAQYLLTEYLKSIPNMTPEPFKIGIQDAQANKEPQYTEKDLDLTNTSETSVQTTPEEVEKMKQEQHEILAKIQKQDSGFTFTESGLLYKTTKTTSGKHPTASSLVALQYKGELLDGSVFDDSKDNAVEFSISDLIPGMTEAIQLMKEGESMIVYIPSHLGYGGRSAGTIPPHSILKFTMTLQKIRS